jgi:hypothetical protein
VAPIQSKAEKTAPFSHPARHSLHIASGGAIKPCILSLHQHIFPTANLPEEPLHHSMQLNGTLMSRFYFVSSHQNGSSCDNTNSLKSFDET